MGYCKIKLGGPVQSRIVKREQLGRTAKVPGKQPAAV